MRAATAIVFLLLCGTAFGQEHKVLINRAVLVPYPDFARRARIQGDARVTLRLRIDGSAEILDVKSHPVFEKAIREAIPKFRFICADCFDEQSIQFMLTVHFDLTQLDACNDEAWRNRISSPNQVEVLASATICTLQT
jgi:hypothetical protein